MRLPVAYSPPRDELESAICAAFSQVLRVVPVGRDDEFYDLGGDSLAGEALSIEIQNVTGKIFPISKLFRHATPAAIAELLGGKARSAADPMRLFVVHGRGGYTTLSPDFRAGFKPDRIITMFELPGIRGDREPIWNIRELAEVYVRQIQQEQPHGPIQLAAMCAGSFIALEMAEVLRLAGRPLHRLVLIDPKAPPQLITRHEAEAALEQQPGSLSAEEYFARTGRWQDAAKDAAALRVEQPRMAEDFRQKMAADQMSFVKRYKGLGFADWPRAVLMTMYRFAWPPPFAGQTHVIASVERIAEIAAPNSIWRRFTPNLSYEVVSDKHSEIGKGEVGRLTAAKLERLMAETT